MKIKKLCILDTSPTVKHFEVDDLDQIVVIAGANGAGKTTIKRAICESFANPRLTRISATIESTRAQERKDWDGNLLTITTESGGDNQTLADYLTTRTRGGKYIGGIFQIDSRREMQQINFAQLMLNNPDPDDSDLGLGYYLNDFSGRWNNIVNSVYLKMAHRLRKLGEFASLPESEERNKTIENFKKSNPEPLLKYQDVVSRLFDYIQLEPISVESQQEFTFTVNGSANVPFRSLSSGEQEAIKIAFDIIHRDIRHCVVIIDEPELHLHPTLTFSLIETLKTLSEGSNQFIFFTHSADIISTYANTGNVYFVDSQNRTSNQAHRLSDLQHEHKALADIIGDKLGLFAVGKKIVFVEGITSGIDKLTYHAILQAYSKNVVIAPVGGVYSFEYLSTIAKEITNQIYGIQFYFLRDRDGLSEAQMAHLSNSGIWCLKRRHIENYFLDEDVLAKVFTRFNVIDKDYKNPTFIKAHLEGIARSLKTSVLLMRAKELVQEKSHFDIPTVKSVKNKTSTEVIDEFVGGLAKSNAKILSSLARAGIESELKRIDGQITAELDSGEWIQTFPGKQIYKAIVSKLGIDKAAERARDIYVREALQNKSDVFMDIKELFKDI